MPSSPVVDADRLGRSPCSGSAVRRQGRYANYQCPWHRTFADIPLSTIYPLGAVAVLLWWLFASRAIRLVRLFAGRMLRRPASRLLRLSWFLLLLLTFPYFLGVILVENARFNAWKKRQDPKWLAEHEPRIKERGLREIYEKQAKWRLDKPYDLAIGWILHTRERLASAATIAVAPFYSIGRLRQALADLPTVPYVDFITVPDIVRIEDDNRARTVVRRYGIDTLL